MGCLRPGFSPGFPVSVSPTCASSADPARVLNMPPVIYVPVGIHGYIRCPVDAEPPATVVKWNKDGRPLQVEKVLERCMLRVGVRAPPSTVMPPLGSGFLPGLLAPSKSPGQTESCFRRGLRVPSAPGWSSCTILRAAWPSWDPAWDGARSL